MGTRGGVRGGHTYDDGVWWWTNHKRTPPGTETSTDDRYLRAPWFQALDDSLHGRVVLPQFAGTKGRIVVSDVTARSGQLSGAAPENQIPPLFTSAD